jgi:hypothetical protein
LRHAPAVAQLRQIRRENLTTAEPRTAPGQRVVAALSRLVSGSISRTARRAYNPSSSAHRSPEQARVGDNTRS